MPRAIARDTASHPRPPRPRPDLARFFAREDGWPRPFERRSASHTHVRPVASSRANKQAASINSALIGNSALVGDGVSNGGRAGHAAGSSYSNLYVSRGSTDRGSKWREDVRDAGAHRSRGWKDGSFGDKKRDGRRARGGDEGNGGWSGCAVDVPGLNRRDAKEPTRPGGKGFSICLLYTSDAADE